MLDKINVEGLKRDLNKFREHYPEQAFSFRSEWVNNIDDFAAVPETWEWPLDALLAAEKVKPYNAEYSFLNTFKHYRTRNASQQNRQVGMVWISKGCMIFIIEELDMYRYLLICLFL